MLVCSPASVSLNTHSACATLTINNGIILAAMLAMVNALHNRCSLAAVGSAVASQTPLSTVPNTRLMLKVSYPVVLQATGQQP